MSAPVQSETTQPAPVVGDQAPEPSGLGEQVLFIAACLVIPILWGVIVHRLFARFRFKRRPENQASSWPDYQI